MLRKTLKVEHCCICVWEKREVKMSRHNKNKCFLEHFCNPKYVGEFLSSKEIQLTDTLICPRKSYFSCFLFLARRSSARRGSTMTWRTIIIDEKFLSLSLFLSSLFLATSFFKKRNSRGGKQGVPAGQSKVGRRALLFVGNAR